jgi:putative cell wall-binding protein
MSARPCPSTRSTSPRWLVVTAALAALMAVAAPVAAAPIFTPQSVPVGPRPSSVAIGDMDGDGSPDLVVARDLVAGVVGVRLGDGTGDFASSGPEFGVGANPYAVVVAHLDADGHLDVATADIGGNTVSVLRGDGQGGLSAATTHAVGRRPVFLAAGDLDGDGHTDLAAAQPDDNSLTVLWGGVDGITGTSTVSGVGAVPVSVAIADVDEDGRADLLSLNAGGDTVTVMRNLGGQSFAPPAPVPVGDNPRSLVVADLDGDGHVDLAAARLTGQRVDIRLGDGTGAFAPPTAPRPDSQASGYYTLSMAVADVDSDGTVDLVTANAFTGDLSVLIGRGDGDFAPVISVPTGYLTVWAAAADLDGDGNADLLAVDSYRGDLVVVLGDGTGRFSTRHAVASQASALAVGDLDGDGHTDVVTASEDHDSGGGASVLLGDGAGSLLPASTIALGAGAQSVAIGTLGSDAVPDVVVAHQYDGHVSVLQGIGDGTFAAAVTHAVPYPQEIEIGDVDGDDIADLVVVGGNSTVYVLQGLTDGTFANPVGHAVGSGPRSVAVADIDGDGLADLVTANHDAGTVSVRLGTGGGSFATAADTPVEAHPHELAVADLDGDGTLDVAIAHTNDGNLGVLLGTGAATGPLFRAPTSVSAGGNPWSLTIGDVHGDGPPDLISANRNTNALAVFRGDGKGGFTRETVHPAAYPWAVVVADMDDDAVVDLVSVSSESVTILRGRRAVLGGPASIDTGASAIGVAAQQTVQLTPTGASTLRIPAGATSLSGPDAARFAVTGDTCSGRLLPSGATCTLTVAHTPTGSGVDSAVLHIASDASAGPSAIPLTGTGSAASTPPPPAPVPLDATVTFTPPTPGTTGPITLTATNTTSQPIQPDDVVIVIDGSAVLGLPDGCTAEASSEGQTVTCTFGLLQPDETLVLHVDVAPSGLIPVAVTIGGTTFTIQPQVAADESDFAIQASRTRFPDAAAFAVAVAGADLGADTTAGGPARHVVLSRDDVFADSLGGSALTATGPLLFTGSDALTPDARAEIDRVLGGSGTVYLLGGSAALSEEIEQTLTVAGYTPIRLWGATRVQTALAVADVVTDLSGSPAQLALARADAPADTPTAAWTDAVAVGGWAADTGQPILLTPSAGLHPDVASWLARHQSVEVVVIGGEAALATEVETAVAALGHLTTRVAGPNRYATAAQIAASLWQAPAEGRLISFADAPDGWSFTLAIAGLSADTDQPILLTELDHLPPDTDGASCSADGIRRPYTLLTPTSRTSHEVLDALARPCE